MSDTASKPSPLTGVGLKLASIVCFVSMSTCVKLLGEMPVGQIVFFRSFFAILPVFLYFSISGEVTGAWSTNNLHLHLIRGVLGVSAMSLSFYALTQLPIADATAISYAKPMFAVALAALLMGEQVRLFRWSAVFAGLLGVLVILWPKLTLFTDGPASEGQAWGALAAFIAALIVAGITLLVRKMVKTEKTPTIVLYFSSFAALAALCSLPFGWQIPTLLQLCLLIITGLTGGVAQILLTQSYRFADISLLAPLDYMSIIFTLMIGLVVFGDALQWPTLLGSAIVIVAGIAIILREKRLGLGRGQARRHLPPV